MQGYMQRWIRKIKEQVVDHKFYKKFNLDKK